MTLEEKLAQRMWAQANPVVAAFRHAMQQLEKAIGRQAGQAGQAGPAGGQAIR
jgi:hypothetical protein